MSIQSFFSFLLFKLRIASYTEVGYHFKQFIFMDNTSPSGFTVSFMSHPRVPPLRSHLWVIPYGPTLGYHLRVMGPGSHLRVLGPTFPVCHIVDSKDTKEAPTQVFSCEYCKIFKYTFFTEHLRWLLLLF